ncbi:TetR family transcriptional regulator [Rhodococcus erythropolis]|jgi:AcrR family transcriptional regulator|uniref:TetR/AcrR family transcriptional regulator n=1 Tax=Rhodococcus erythropolis TaxID=1833 RepID=UPI00061B7577|nr:TetR/AcrR family transcriptional regulator [Rhodococcus erythropolis]AKD99011.1 TetR family transcriptional regulator [Rhodococcus erythropolis]ORI26838.1 TetR family transcriptional regulator [Rhodococcus erythropolis]
MEQPRRRGRTSDAERADRRNEILDVAVDSFREVGFARTTIDAIATAAGVAKRTVYSYFGDKSAVFAAAVSRQHAYVENAGGDQSDLLAAAVDIVVALHSDNSIALHRMMIGEAVQFPELAAAFYESGPAKSIAFLEKILIDQHGQKDALCADQLYTLLLGEEHRQRLLGLASEPTAERAAQLAARAVGCVLGSDR